EFTRLRMDHDAIDLFETLYPNAAASFMRLNERAQFPFVAEESSSKTRRSLLQAAAAVCQMDPSVQKQSCLPMLLELCRPNECASYFDLQSQFLARHADAEEGW